MTRSQWQHALQWIAELGFGRRVRATGQAEDAAFAAARANLVN